MFSSRLAWPVAPNRLSRLLREKRHAGAPVLDLTESNPTRVGLAYPERKIASALGEQEAATYAPEARGALAARQAISSYYAQRGLDVPPGRIVLTASTSEAYAFLFKLSIDPGDPIFVPRPGYPLFDYLAALESGAVVDYRVEHDGARWGIDFDSLYRAADGKPAGAVVVVNPNNPTGSALTPDEAATLDRFCADRDAPLIADEVFWDFLFATGAGAVSTLQPLGERGEDRRALTFTLGGLSKSCGLPHLKLAWIVVGGPPAGVEEALQRLDLVSDSYLSVGAPVQLAAGRLFGLSGAVRQQVRARVRENRGRLSAMLGEESPCRLFDADGGWYAVLRVPAVQPEEELVLELLRSDDVLVHPGYFFDFPREAYLVLSLLPEPADFVEACRRMLARVNRG